MAHGNDVALSRKAAEIVIAFCAAGKGVLGAGQLAVQLSGEELYAVIPLSVMLLSGLGGVGFYRSQARLGIDLWERILRGSQNLSLEQGEIVVERKKIKAGIILGALGFALTQGMSMILAGGEGALPIVFALSVLLANLIIGPPNMVAFFRQLGWLRENEIKYLHPRELAEPINSKRLKTLFSVYAVIGAGTNILSGAAMILKLAQYSYLQPQSSLLVKVPTITVALLTGALCSSVAVGMNIDGANKTHAEVKAKGGWANFLLEGRNILYMGLVLAANSLPSNYAGTLAASLTIQEFDSFFGHHDINTIEQMVSEREFFGGVANISVFCALVVVASCGIAAQTLNKGPAAKQVIMDIKSGAETVAKVSYLGIKKTVSTATKCLFALRGNSQEEKAPLLGEYTLER